MVAVRLWRQDGHGGERTTIAGYAGTVGDRPEEVGVEPERVHAEYLYETMTG